MCLSPSLDQPAVATRVAGLAADRPLCRIAKRIALRTGGAATITGREGQLDWTTDTAELVDITQAEVDLGDVMLVWVSSEQTQRA